MPWLITKADISRRTGWTFSALDEQDASEVLPALIGQSIRDALNRVDAYVNSQGRIGIDPEDLKIYKQIDDLISEQDNG